MFRIISLVSLLLLAGCQSSNDTELTTTQRLEAPKASEQLIRKRLANKTLITYDRFHGMQIEYHSAGGRNYLWYPGNTVVLPGYWKLEPRQTAGKFNICYKYGANTYNPVTRSRGARWECGSASGRNQRSQETRNGDIFGLAGRVRVPFILDRKKASINSLLSRI